MQSPRIFPCSKLMGAATPFKVAIFSPLRNSLFAIILAPSHPYIAYVVSGCLQNLKLSVFC